MLAAITGIVLELAPWLLLGALIAGVLHVALPRDFVRRTLSGKRGVLRAVALGVPLPLCSCGVIPAGIGLKKDGASDGAALGFLIATPQTGVDSVLVSGALLGWPFALFKVLSALVLGVIGGTLVDKAAGPSAGSMPTVSPVSPAAPERSRPWWRELVAHSIELIRMIWGWLVVGILASAALGYWLPTLDWGAKLAEGSLTPLVLALLLSLPLYVCATASVPIAAALVAGGLPLGAALVFLVAGPATNLATIGAVHRAFGRRTLIIYLGTLVIGSLGLGLAFDFLLAGVPLEPALHSHEVAGWRAIPALVLMVLLTWFAGDALRLKLRDWRQRLARGFADRIEVQVEGMTCQGCARRLKTQLVELHGVDVAEVDLERGAAVLYGKIDGDTVREAVRKAGFIAH